MNNSKDETLLKCKYFGPEKDCFEYLNCCSCGDNDCGCRYCFDCNACEVCKKETE